MVKKAIYFLFAFLAFFVVYWTLIGYNPFVGLKEKEPMPSSDKTAEQIVLRKTYLSEKYGFEMDYPEAAGVKNIKEGVVAIKSSEKILLTILVDREAAFSLDKIIEDKIDSLSVTEHRKIMFAGKEAYEGVDLGVVNSYGIFVKNGDIFYELIFNTDNKSSFEENKAALSEEQEMMLSAFKFSK